MSKPPDGWMIRGSVSLLPANEMMLARNNLDSHIPLFAPNEPFKS